MTTDFALDNYMIIEAKKAEDEITLKTVTDVIKGSFQKVSFVEEDTTDKDCDKLFSQATLAMKSLSNAYYKSTKSLDLMDIEQIRISLNHYSSNNKKVSEFKKELLDDLDDFQKQIKANYAERISELRKKHKLLERQIKSLDSEKHQLIMNRLAAIVWPYDEKTKEYDNNIAKLEAQAKQYERRIAEAEKMRPMASERDILIYQMHMKDKFRRNI